MYYHVWSKFICTGEPYDIQATVHAVNYQTAHVQLDWITQNKDCMCKECLQEYTKQYSTSIVLPEGMPIYRMCVKN